MASSRMEKRAFKGEGLGESIPLHAASIHTHTWTGYESYSTRGLYIIPSTGVCMYFRTAGIVGAQKGATGRQGTRSHFQVGFRTARPLEGTSNDSDIAAREFKSLTPSGSLSIRTRTACLLRFLYICVPVYTHAHIYISISLSISPSMARS